MRKAIIMGAAGRDFHNFNTYFRKNSNYEVVAFTATQIPNISGRKYPASLAGKRYQKGIPIFPESKLSELIKKHKIDEVFFSYSDVSHEYVMHKASLVEAEGASFVLLGPRDTQIKSRRKIISVCAVRTGSGKSPFSQKLVKTLNKMGKKVVAIRHPMPYGDLAKQAVQRFGSFKDLDKYNCTIEEREEYESYVEMGIPIYAGVDYEKILRRAEKEAEVIIWDGGNNDFPFYVPDMSVVVADPLRPGHEVRYYPGETNFRSADVIVINKENSAKKRDIEQVMEHAKGLNPKAKVLHANCSITVSDSKLIKGKSVLVIEDGPTLTHGEMSYGAGYLAAVKNKAKIVEPKKYAVGSIKEAYKKFKQLGNILPAMGYGKKQLKELEKTINSVPCDAVVIATPVRLQNYVKIKKPYVHVKYALSEKGWKMRELIKKVVK